MLSKEKPFTSDTDMTCPRSQNKEDLTLFANLDLTSLFMSQAKT